MIAISVIFEVDPAHKEEFLTLSLAHAQNAKTREEGCLDFRIFRSQEKLYERAAALTDKSLDEKRHRVFTVRTAPTSRKKGRNNA